MSEQAKLLVAVSAYGSSAVVVDVHGEAAEHKISSIGVDPEEHGIAHPQEHGLHVWDGVLTNSIWHGTWRTPNGEEWARLMLGRPVWE